MADNMYTPQNPIEQYPQPPFEPQQQSAPGDVHAMKPEPDHGETSYVGKERLVGFRGIVTGGDSGIGRAAAIALSREGADLVLSYLPSEQTDAEEVRDLGDTFEVVCEPTDLVAVRTALQDAGIEYDSAEAGFVPSVVVDLDEDSAGKVFRLIDALEDCDDVQNVYANYDVSDEVMELIG